MTIEDLYINDYSPKSFVMRGDTKSYKETLKKLGGKYINIPWIYICSIMQFF